MPETVVRHGVAFAVIPLETCLERATALQAGGRPWHSHVLSPGCAHNPDPRRYAIVIEDEREGVAHIAFSEAFPEVDKQLVKMLHGDDILDPVRAEADDSGSVRGSALIARLASLQAKQALWHHHMHFPACVLSPRPGRWCIAVESDDGTFSEAFDEEPAAVLRQVEVLYFENLEARCQEG